MKSLRKKTGARKDKLNEPDEFLSLTQKVMLYAQANSKQAYTVIGVVVVAALLAVVASYIMREAKTQAQTNLAEAIKYYDTNSPVPGDKPMEPGERYKKAREMFAELAKKSGPLGLTAAYYEANSAMELGDMDAAIAGYKAVIAKASADPALASLASLRLSEAYRFKGDRQLAMDTLTAMTNIAGGGLKDEAQFRIAGMLQEDGKTDQALAAYKKLVEEYPDSPWKGDANAKAIQLGGSAAVSGLTPPPGVPAGAIPVQVKPGEGGKPNQIVPVEAAPAPKEQKK
ncbi:MAG: tetratricopeptide repeat protein [Nitrospirae bacterium]|nr:tetratricopeptide repeat protein [Nitrospirota bacterium]MBI5696207.1 tetratricopeptide repeat protein [Nitrospirota bacterium]